MNNRLLHLVLRTESDVFVARQRAREVAAAVGLEHQDQVRLATALSEIGRSLFTTRGGPPATGAEVWFAVNSGKLEVEVVAVGPSQAAQLPSLGRLVDSLTIDDGPTTTVVRMSRRIPGGVDLTPDDLDRIRAALAASAPRTPLDEMAEQNEQLLAALEETRAHRDDLARLNAELEETNRGVMALYSQLSDELEETNRGVVALYAELDERSAQLRAASEAKTRFLANVSHELRAPVTAVIGLARLLDDPESDPLTDDQTQQVSLIRGSADDLLRLVNDLLDLAKAESGTIEPDWSEVDLRVLFSQLRGTVRAMATGAVELVVTDPEQPATIRSDEVLIAQVLRNLLHNGLKFTAAGEVRMTATRDGDGWLIRVADTGIGISAELHDRIFEEFYQVPGRSPSGMKGTGLGLPYARRLVTLLGGTLTVASEPGAGSTFTVRLPAAGHDGAS
ncbi:sensor histidine kinase [Asanoa ishikariensis]|uniref:histidine kinase n=1 Tax=Asanoa ishikariensis TaxID=137265 RepID=A0A1H3ML38_9ACTN|nr:sensor histidine kinase [Asanoa ishikariensis]GIF66189.1 sensor histidine kinase [Asanoa ishikariensis]SDY77148.1 Signal transduction histidine kinase [Asanoa ishikariensis]